jgi:serine/threonine-protein kinase RsbW
MQARLSLRVDKGALRRVRRFVAEFGAARRIGRAEQARIAILVEELLTNLMKYGDLGFIRPPHVNVALGIVGKQVTIVFEDDGSAFNLLTQPAPDLDRPLEERPIGLLGLHIVRALADDVSYRRVRGRNVIRLVRRLGPYRPAKPARIADRRK